MRYKIQITGRMEMVRHYNRQRIPIGNEKECRLQHTGNHYGRDPYHLQDVNGQRMTRWRCVYVKTY